MVVDKYLIYLGIDEENTKVHGVAFSRANRTKAKFWKKSDLILYKLDNLYYKK